MDVPLSLAYDKPNISLDEIFLNNDETTVFSCVKSGPYPTLELIRETLGNQKDFHEYCLRTSSISRRWLPYSCFQNLLLRPKFIFAIDRSSAWSSYR